MVERGQRTREQVARLMQEIIAGAVDVRDMRGVTVDDWHRQCLHLAGWLQVALSNVSDLLPDEVQAFVLELSSLYDEVKHQAPAGTYWAGWR